MPNNALSSSLGLTDLMRVIFADDSQQKSGNLRRTRVIKDNGGADAQMGEIMEIVLTLEQVTNSLTELEHRYGVSTEDLLQSKSLQRRVSPDDLFIWYTMVDHRQSMEEEQLDRQYLTRISGEPSCVKDKGEVQLNLAA